MNRQTPRTAELPRLEVRSADLPREPDIVPFRGSQPDGYYDPPHTHDRAQFSYRIEGFSVVRIAGQSVFLPPGRGVWIPAGTVHAVTCRGPAAYNAFYVSDRVRPRDEALRVIAVSPLLHALVEALIDEGDTAPDLRRQRIMELVLDEIARARDVGRTAPVMPRSPRLREVCDELASDPANPLDLDGWAARAGMSRRTFTRAFRQETGLSPGKWYQQLRMHHVDGLLESGMPLQKVAFQLGYGSTASLGRAYARALGEGASAARLPQP